MTAALSHDPLCPRAGDWRALDAASAADRLDAALLGVPAFRTSLSPTGADATPTAVREALRRYSPTLMGTPPVDLAAALRLADAGDVADPYGAAG